VRGAASLFASKGTREGRASLPVRGGAKISTPIYMGPAGGGEQVADFEYGPPPPKEKEEGGRTQDLRVASRTAAYTRPARGGGGRPGTP
jgi:hypothetical protein